jgi:hypothetical protein
VRFFAILSITEGHWESAFTLGSQGCLSRAAGKFILLKPRVSRCDLVRKGRSSKNLGDQRHRGKARWAYQLL